MPRLLALHLTLVLGSWLVLPLSSAAQVPGDEWVRVTGVVLDREDGQPLRGANVVLDGQWHAVTTEHGRFEFMGVLPSLHELGVYRIGFQVVADTFRIEPGLNTDLRVLMDRDAVELDPVVVQARKTMGKMQPFYERRSGGLGRYITREDIEDWQPTLITEMLGIQPGVTRVPRGNNSYDILMRGCRPALWIDNAYIGGGNLPFDHFLTPNDVEGIEVYSASVAPAQYNRGARCGAVLVWTRVPEVDRPKRSRLGRALVATGIGAVAALLLLVTR